MHVYLLIAVVIVCCLGIIWEDMRTEIAREQSRISSQLQDEDECIHGAEEYFWIIYNGAVAIEILN